MKPRADSRIRMFAAAVAVLRIVSALGASEPPRPALVGMEAPALDAPGVVVVAEGDTPGTKPVTLIFSKPADAHTKDAVAALRELHLRNPRLDEGSRTVLVLSRLDAGASFPAPTLPPRWRVLDDTGDSLYSSYRIIATPTTVVVGSDNVVVGFHPGYNSGLADAVRRDLTVAIDGADSLNVPTPTPGIMDVQMGRRLADRRLWDRALEYYRKAAAEGPLPCEIALEEVAIHLEIRQGKEALQLLDAMGDASQCAAEAAALRGRASAMIAGRPEEERKPPAVP